MFTKLLVITRPKGEVPIDRSTKETKIKVTLNKTLKSFIALVTSGKEISDYKFLFSI
jgi:hypothetical protein